MLTLRFLKSMPLKLVSMERKGWRYRRGGSLLKEESAWGVRDYREKYEKGQSQTLKVLENQARVQCAFTQIKTLLERIASTTLLVWERSENIGFLRKLRSILKRTPGT